MYLHIIHIYIHIYTCTRICICLWYVCVHVYAYCVHIYAHVIHVLRSSSIRTHTSPHAQISLALQKWWSKVGGISWCHPFHLASQAWNVYCDCHGSGVRDPRRPGLSLESVLRWRRLNMSCWVATWDPYKLFGEFLQLHVILCISIPSIFLVTG